MIFYFSGTGNSQYTAQKLAASLDDKAVAINDCINNNQLSFTLAEDERIGFVFPVYFWGVPTIVLNFIAKLDLQGYGDHYTYVVLTCGGDSGNTQTMFKKRLAERDIRLDGAYEVYMPDNYILMFNLLTPEEKAKKMLDAAEGTIAAIAEEIQNRKPAPIMHSAGRWLKTAFSYPIYKRGRNTRPFYATADCNGCGLCAKQCPCTMIEMQHNRLPKWKDGKCTQCLSCLHRCPKRAIQYGRKTEKRGRYVNPNA